MLNKLLVRVKIEIPSVIFSESKLKQNFMFGGQFNQIHELVWVLSEHKLTKKPLKLKFVLAMVHNLSPLFTNELKETAFILLSLKNQDGSLFFQNGLTHSSEW